MSVTTLSREQQITSIAAEATCSTRTVRRYLDGSRVIPAIENAIVAAAKALRLDLDRIRRRRGRAS